MVYEPDASGVKPKLRVCVAVESAVDVIDVYVVAVVQF
jgi:hypothetical protein